MARVRLEVWNPEGTHQLRTARGVPAIDVLGGLDAPLSDLLDGARRHLGVDVALLRLDDHGAAEMDCLDSTAPLPRGLSWRPGQLSPSLAERVMWERPGWLGQTLQTIDQALAGVGLQRNGAPSQERHWLLAAILRIPTTDGDVWFKAVPPLCAHEGPVTAWLAGIAPAAVPTVVASGTGWWIAAEFPAEADDPQGHPLDTLARLQITSSARTDELRQLGCPDRGLDRLVEEMASLTERTDLLPPSTATSLRNSLRDLQKLCAQVDQLGIPSSLVHGDLNRDNVRWTQQGWFLYDWSDACIAHPFVDVDGWPDDHDHHGAVWAEAVSPHSVQRVLELATALWAAHRAVSYRRIVDAFPRPDTEGGIHKLQQCVVRLLDGLGSLSTRG